MKLHQSRTFSVLLAAGVLVGGANIAAYAANGGKFTLGHTNKESRPSVLKNTGAGPALKLKSRASAPSLAVSNGRKIAKLNADKVDGMEGTSLQTRSVIYRIPAENGVSSFELVLPGLTSGVYQASFSVIAGMSATGAKLNCHFRRAGGFYELMGYGSTFSSYSTSNASGIIDLRSQPATFRCFTDGGTANVDQDFANQSQIVMTRINALTNGGTPTPPVRPGVVKRGGSR